jgi:hypothetical protein
MRACPAGNGKGACACGLPQVSNIRLWPSPREEHRGSDMSWGWFVVLVIAAWAGFLFVSLSCTKRVRAVSRALRREADLAGRARAIEFESGMGDNWPVRMHSGGDRERDYLMMSDDQSQLRFVALRLQPELEFKSDDMISVTTVVSVELQQSSHTIMRYETATGTRKGSLSCARQSAA